MYDLELYAMYKFWNIGVVTSLTKSSDVEWEEEEIWG